MGLLTSWRESRLSVGRKDEKSVHRTMSTPDHDCLDTETILNDLCASKINASISLIGDGGFHFVLGDPPQAEGWAFSTIGAAAISLRDEACAYYPDSDFARKHGGFVYDHPWLKGEVTTASLLGSSHGSRSGSPKPII